MDYELRAAVERIETNLGKVLARLERLERRRPPEPEAMIRDPKRIAALEASLRELVAAQDGQTALDFPGADIRAVEAYARFHAALAQAQKLLLGEEDP